MEDMMSEKHVIAVVGLVGEIARLIPAEPEYHLENLYRWTNDPRVLRHLSSAGLFSLQETQKHLNNTLNDPNSYYWAIVLRDAGSHVGFAKLLINDLKNGVAVTGTLIDPKYWRKGIATDVMRIRIRFAFEELRLHRLETGAMVGNRGSWRAMEKAGYQREGRQRKRYFSDGQWHDGYTYALLAEDYFEAL